MTDPFNPSPRLGDRLEELENKLRDFGKITRQELLFKLAAFGLKDRAEISESLYSSVRNLLRKRNGDIEGVGWSFARHGIFFERGVGKGRPVGSAAAAKAANPWLYPTLDSSINKLADLLAEEYADIVAAELVIRIPGVIDTTIR